MEKNTVICGDALKVLKTLEKHSVDSIVTDPPAGIDFMGKEWDGDKGGRDKWIAWLTTIMREALRVLKPGGHAFVWSLPRTSHWTAMALEDAGFEIRDCITHIQGQGFPKSTNAGGGVGTALKPACEFWWLVRKPIARETVERNIVTYRTGGLNIDACRIEGVVPQVTQDINSNGSGYKIAKTTQLSHPHLQGRWPSHLLLSHTEECTQDACTGECAVAALDKQSGICKSTKSVRVRVGSVIGNGNTHGYMVSSYDGIGGYDDQGGASRYFQQFFYTPKVSRKERNAGCEGLPELPSTKQFNEGMEGQLRSDGTMIKEPIKQSNSHPTIKPLALMRWLIRLITPTKGTVLDVFSGSGSTLVAAIQEDRYFIGIEKDHGYCEIAQARVADALQKKR